MPATLRSQLTSSLKQPRVAVELGPEGPFPNTTLGKVLERRWLHYAFLSRDHELGMVANVAWLGPGLESSDAAPRCTSILLVHKRGEGWSASQFNAETSTPLWSAFRQPRYAEHSGDLHLAATSSSPSVKLQLVSSSRPCTSQCATFAPNQHLRWQSETGVIARGDWQFKGETYHDVEAIGYHERVRGYWGWPELGGWVFGFANDPHGPTDQPPATAFVFTLIQPRGPEDAATGSVMVWRNGRLRRHFPRRCVTFAVRGQLQRDKVQQVPELSNLFGVPPMEPVPRQLMISARMGDDWVTYDYHCDSAARVIIPSETSLRPFSVHEVIGPVLVEGCIGGEAFRFETYGIAEFAGGAGDDR